MPLTHFEVKNPYEKEMLALEDEFLDWQKRWVELHKKMPEQEIDDYLLHTWNGRKKLSDLFGYKDEMILIHNMGKSCRYCTLWADGINGSLQHLQSRASLLVLSPDPSDVQKEFALSRNWDFTMASGSSSTIIEDMGFYNPKKKSYSPGFSILKLTDDGRIIRTTRVGFGPGDLYCHVWHFFALLPDAGQTEWVPQLQYLK